MECLDSTANVMDGDTTWIDYSRDGVNDAEKFTGKSLKIKSTGRRRGVRSG